MIYIIDVEGQEKLTEVSTADAKLVDAGVKIEKITVSRDSWKQLEALSQVSFEAGDIVLQAGACARHTTLAIAEVAREKRINLMPGQGVDHRGVPIPPKMMQHRLPIENNGYTAWPYTFVVGDPDSAKLSFELLPKLDSADYWPEYTPEEPTLQHLLAVVAVIGNWETPGWFEVVDMSIRDLDLAPVMYASHMWHDWIAFYPSNGNFKLENHSQLRPIWLAESEKPLEYWNR